jgi:hypothetical protein
MAVYKLFPSQDATIYSLFPNMNTGLDEVIEATETSFAYSTPNPQTSRFLINFSETEIDDLLDNKLKVTSGSISSSKFLDNNYWRVNLQCFIATSTGLQADTTVECYPISGAWDMGTGRYLDDPLQTNGTSWYWRDYSGSSLWSTQNYNSFSTGSYTGSSPNNSINPYAGGATWWTGSTQPWFNSNLYPISASVTFGFFDTKDLNLNVTNIVRARSTGSISADGFILKQAVEFIYDKEVQPELKYFSRDTHTIYPPALQFSWRDYSFNTGSSTQTILNTLPATVTLAQNPGTFYPQSFNRFRVNIRPEFPIQLWQTSSVYLNNYYLPTASYWAIKDLDTNEMVIDFDTQFTQLSADASSSYFDVYMNGLEPERYYAILIKSEIAGTTQVFDDQYYFKVING